MAIMSGDPKAIEKLKAEIAALEKRQEMMKGINKLIKKKGGPDRVNLAHLYNLSDAEIDKLLKPDWCGRIGFADYEITNNGANIRRLKGRLEELAGKVDDVTTTEEMGDVTITDNVEENRLQVEFPGKPKREIIDFLKSHGFKWSPTNGVWQRFRSSDAMYYARKAAEMSLPPLPPPEPGYKARLEAAGHMDDPDAAMAEITGTFKSVFGKAAT